MAIAMAGTTFCGLYRLSFDVLTDGTQSLGFENMKIGLLVLGRPLYGLETKRRNKTTGGHGEWRGERLLQTTLATTRYHETDNGPPTRCQWRQCPVEA